MSSVRDVSAVVDAYFGGIYTGDVSRLRSAFHPSAVLWGELDAQSYYKPLEAYLEAVQARKSPETLGEPFAMQLLSVEVHGSIARAQVRCTMLGFDYLDFLSLVRENGNWSIVAKVFTLRAA